MDGIMHPKRKHTELTELLIKTLGPAKQKGMTLEDHLAQLDERTFQHLMQVAKLVKLAMAMQHKPISYHDLAKRMYPKLGHYKLAMIGEMLQLADPITLPAQTSPESTREGGTAPEGLASKLPGSEAPRDATEGLTERSVPSSNSEQLNFLDQPAISESSGKMPG